MFYVEGNSAAILVTNARGKMSKRSMSFATAEAALTWCRQHRASLIYQPSDVSGN